MKSIKIIKHLGNTIFITAILLLSSIPLLAEPPIKAGAAMENITPPLGTIINGNFLPYYAKTIHDSLYAKALAFDNGKQRFVFVVVDCMSMDGALISDAKKLIKQKLGLLSSQIMISSTHAHSCGAVRGGSICPADLAYRLAMPEKITKAVKNAMANLQPAKIAWGHIDVPQHTSCRRWFMKPGFNTISPFGDTDRVWMNPPMGSPFLDKSAAPTDPQVSYLAVKNLKDEWISIMANYSIHYAADVPDHAISADYFGEVHQQLQVKLNAGDNFVGIMSNGTSGDVNTFDFKQERNYSDKPYAKSKLIANDVSDSIIHSLRTASFESRPIFKFAYQEFEAATRQPTKAQVTKAKAMIGQLDYSTLNSIDKASMTIVNAYAIDQVAMNEYQPKQIKLPLQTIRICNGTIGTLPGEFFSETGLWLKQQAVSKYYFTICLSNADVGYVPPANQHKLGGYETWLCTTSQMEIRTEEKLRNELLKLIKHIN